MQFCKQTHLKSVTVGHLVSVVFKLSQTQAYLTVNVIIPFEVTWLAWQHVQMNMLHDRQKKKRHRTAINHIMGKLFKIFQLSHIYTCNQTTQIYVQSFIMMPSNVFEQKLLPLQHYLYQLFLFNDNNSSTVKDIYTQFQPHTLFSQTQLSCKQQVVSDFAKTLTLILTPVFGHLYK